MLFNNIVNLKNEKKSLSGKDKPSARNFFPIPIQRDNEVFWPLDRPAFLVFNCFLNRNDRCVDVIDIPSIQALYYFGFFGKGSLSSHAPIYDLVQETLLTIPQGDLDEHNPSSQIRALTEAFGPLPKLDKLVKKLYGKRSRSSSPCCIPSFTFQSISHESEGQSKETISSLSNKSGEILKLSLEEAYFLSYALGVLTITDPTNSLKLNLNQIWEIFCQLYDDIYSFPTFYACYHHFRSKGWVVKSGTKFGSHFLLYKDGPPFYHSLFLLTVIRKISGQIPQPKLSWQYLIAYQRISQGVKKKAVLCYVCLPSDLSPEELKSPKVIKRFEIQTVLLDRWEPFRGREICYDGDI